MRTDAHHICGIIPPHIIVALADSADGARRRQLMETLSLSAQTRGRRTILGLMAISVPTGEMRRTVYDVKHSTVLPGQRVRGEGDAPSNDAAVDEAYDGAGTTYDFYLKSFGRNSIDGNGLRMDSSVHYGHLYDNALWDGQQMIYGDGDGQIFERFTKSIDVIGHELTHGVTQYEAGLDYSGQSGALNESFSDVFGSMVKQFSLGQTTQTADWLIGADLMNPSVQGTGGRPAALRSMAAPGTAYDDPNLGGRDPQPDHMSNYINTNEDNGGVHLNSGIPNRAFYLAATAIGGQSWGPAGRTWYEALRRLSHDSDFGHAKATTIAVAGELFGPGGNVQSAVQQAWGTVGV